MCKRAAGSTTPSCRSPMKTCPTCGAERRYVGVQCPARTLCACETGHTCTDCGEPAKVVEFQQRIIGEEPPLDAGVCMCLEHAPTGLAPEDVQPVLAPSPKPSTKKAQRTDAPPRGKNVIFDRAFGAGEDFGRREDVQVGDTVTFIPDKMTFISRRAAEVCGRVIVTEAFPGERAQTIPLECVTRVTRGN